MGQKQNKILLILLDLCLLIGCLGIVLLIGGRPGSPDNRTHTEQTPDSIRQEEPAASPSNASDGGGQTGDENRLETQEKDDGETDGKWSQAYREWYWKNRDQEMGLVRPDGPEPESEPEPPYIPPVIMMASDLHYMSGTTHDDGEAFQKMVRSDDGKISSYSEEMIDTLLAEAVENQVSVLVLSGDITLNGERENHERLAEKLRKVQEAGVPVAVIPGNHDINNKNAATYFGDQRETAEYLRSGEEFLEIYHEFGYDQSPNRDPDSLSYVFPVDEKHWLLMLDTCRYEDENHVSGRLKPETLAWLEVHLKAARDHHIQVLPVGHHNLLSESRLYKTECTMDHYEEVTALFERYEVPLYVSGHLHAQRIKKHKAGPDVSDDACGISEIVLSPYSIAPNQYGRLSFNEAGDMKFETMRADVAAYAARQGRIEEELLQFDTFSVGFFKQVVKDQVKETITQVPEDLKETMAELYANLYFDYCAGNRMTWDSVSTTGGYQLWRRVEPHSSYVAKMGEMIEDGKKELHGWEWESPG